MSPSETDEEGDGEADDENGVPSHIVWESSGEEDSAGVHSSPTGSEGKKKPQNKQLDNNCQDRPKLFTTMGS